MAESATAAMAPVRNFNPECRFNMTRPLSVDRLTPARPMPPGIHLRGPHRRAAKRVPPLLQNEHTAPRFAAGRKRVHRQCVMTARSERLAAAQIFGRFVLLNFQM